MQTLWICVNKRSPCFNLSRASYSWFSCIRPWYLGNGRPQLALVFRSIWCWSSPRSRPSPLPSALRGWRRRWSWLEFWLFCRLRVALSASPRRFPDSETSCPRRVRPRTSPCPPGSVWRDRRSDFWWCFWYCCVQPIAGHGAKIWQKFTSTLAHHPMDLTLCGALLSASVMTPKMLTATISSEPSW